MRQPCPKEFRDDVVSVALNRHEKTTIAQIAKDFGVHEGTINKCFGQADIDAGNKPGRTTDESDDEARVPVAGESADQLCSTRL